ncbi:MAG: putative toxin-antitoxin system toxin component, PIN family [Muribaculaceae bacterium]|nr:putative toxin-antitoxin system toxin component, PIN family [Muribaculaceae bacterium]
MKDANKIYAVIDTNVIVSALMNSNKNSNPNQVIHAINIGHITPIYNDEIESEYVRVLHYPKLRISQEQINTFISTIRKFGIKVNRTKVADEIFPDPDDIVFYEVRMSVDDSYLVTGNLKHFPIKPFVVTPTQIVEILKERNLI